MNYETTELLREGLTERGIEWRSGLECVTFVGDWCFVEYDYGKLAATCEPVLTPEQAIAVTLGRPKAKSHPYGYERDTGCYDSTRCECGCINDISARYCNDCGGEIEIDESAEKEYYDGYSKHTVFAKKHDDGSLEFCERRYVPEDAAMLGSELPYDELNATIGCDNCVAGRLRGIAAGMRNIGASPMTSHELFALWARRVDKVADLVDSMCGVNPDGLPIGLTISDDGALLNWKGENYVRQLTPGSEGERESNMESCR